MHEHILFKCKKCRTVLFSDDLACTVHGEAFKTGIHCDCDKFDVWYVKDEQVCDWMKIQLDKENWVKGKVSCPKCESRIGAFNFVGGRKCPCSLAVVPPIHIVKSKVDLHKNIELSQ